MRGSRGNGLWIYYPTKTLSQMLSHGVSHSVALAVHAIGDKANSLVLSALAASVDVEWESVD